MATSLNQSVQLFPRGFTNPAISERLWGLCRRIPDASNRGTGARPHWRHVRTTNLLLLLRMIQGLSVGGGRLRLDPLKCEDIPPANAWFLAKGDPICFAIRQAMVLLPIVFYSGITPLLHPLFPGGIAMRQFLLLSPPHCCLPGSRI